MRISTQYWDSCHINHFAMRILSPFMVDLAVLMLCFNHFTYIRKYQKNSDFRILDEYECSHFSLMKLIMSGIVHLFHPNCHIWGWKNMYPGKIVPILFTLFIYLCGRLVLVITFKSRACWYFWDFILKLSLSNHFLLVSSSYSYLLFLAHSQDWRCACLMCRRG